MEKTDPLSASSYFHPLGSTRYDPIRKEMVAMAVQQGYDQDSMLEHHVSWADDQDPFGHVKNAAYPHWTSACNSRYFETFAGILQDKWDEFINAKGVGIVVRQSTMELLRPVVYPDAVLVAVRLDQVRSDRYHVVTSVWSYNQKRLVAQSSGFLVFYDFRTNKTAHLQDYGGVHAQLHAELTERCRKSNAMSAKWNEENPNAKSKPKPTKPGPKI